MTEKTSGMVDGAFLQKMNQTAVLINTAHCGLVAEADLEEHLKENTGFKYAADTFEEQPDSASRWSNAISKHPRVHGSHHCGGLTKQAFKAQSDEVARIVGQYFGTKAIEANVHCNKAAPRKQLRSLTVRHLSCLVPVFTVLAKYGINVEEMENVLLEGREASVARISVSSGNFANFQDIIS